MSSPSDEVSATGINSSPGSRLQIAREALGISQKTLADDLYLPRNYILWIEEGSYEKLPSMVFCKGYIRAYAKAVKEDGEEMIRLLDNIYGTQTIKTPLMSVSKIDEQVKVGDPVMKWSSLVFVLILCGLVFWWWDKQYGLTAPFLETDDAVAVETVNGDEVILQSLDTNTATTAISSELSAEELIQAHAQKATSATILGASAVNPSSNVIRNGSGIELALNLEETAVDQDFAELEKAVKSLEPEPSTAVASLSAQTANATASAPVSVDIKLLQIQFSDDCWVTIKDARGKTLFNGIKSSGQKLSLSGDTPLKVSIGRVNSVSSLKFGGVNIDLNALSRNNIANFKLPL